MKNRLRIGNALALARPRASVWLRAIWALGLLAAAALSSAAPGVIDIR